MTISVGKLRGLQKIAAADGIFTMCAMDHRGSLESLVCPGAAEAACYQGMVRFKQDLCRTLAPLSSAVLLDPIYGAAQCLSKGLVPKNTGLLVSLEATGYAGDSQSRETRLLADWSAAKIKRMGADAVKLLVYYRPEIKPLAQRQLQLVRSVAEDCRSLDVAFLVEPVSYPLGEEINQPLLFARRKPEIVIQTARDMTSVPIDVFKAEFPADLHYHGSEDALDYCRRLDAASAAPWVILSAGVDYDTFCRQVRIACCAGASGYLAGRAVWQEAVTMVDAEIRGHFLETVAAGRLKKLIEIACAYARPWHQKPGLKSDALLAIESGWHMRYGATAT